MMRYSGLAAMIFIMSLLLISSGLAEDAASEEMNTPANIAINDSTSTAMNSTVISETNYTSESYWANALEVQGIWSSSLDESNIVMALNESDGIIFGLARSEGSSPWNGIVTGLLFGDDAHLSLAAVEDSFPVSIHISCTLNDGWMNGSYVRYSSTIGSSRGSFSAILINPDISSYTPAPTEEPQEVVEEEGEEEKETFIPVNADDAGSEPSLQTRGRFNDVRQVAKGINPNIMPNMAAI